MRIVMLVDGLALSGGMQKLVLRTAAQLTTVGHDVRVLTRELDTAACYPELIASVHVDAAPAGSSQLDAAHWYAGRLAGADVVVVHDVAGLPAVRSRRRTGSARVVWMLNHEFETKDFSYARVVTRTVRHSRGLRGRGAAVGLGLRTAHMRRQGVGNVDAAATYDRDNAQRVRAARGVRAKIVYAGADLAEFEQIRSRRSDDADRGAEEFLVLSVGVLMPHRRYEDVIRAVASDTLSGRRVRLVIVGSTTLGEEYADRLRRLVADLRLESQVELRGAVGRDELMDLYARADAFAFVNDGHTWGISVFEALAAGVPVVLTDTIGAADLLVAEEHAKFVPPRDPIAIAAALAELMTAPDHGREATDRAHRHIAGLLTWEQFAERLLSAAGPVAAGTAGAAVGNAPA